MNTYGDNITTSMENSRNSLRRIARHDDTEFSNQSILNAMEKFVKSVSAMDETILVPCRLMDLKVGDEQDPAAKQHASNPQTTGPNAKNSGKQSINTLLNAADLFDVYNMLNTIKDDLLWGQGQAPELDEDVKPKEPTPTPAAATKTQQPSQTSSTTTSTTTTTPQAKGHVRRPSTVSVSSTNSSASSISDSDSEIGNENDSGIEESHQDVADRTHQVAANFKRHLHGLTRSLRQLTDAAQYVTTRYQQDIGAPI